MRRGGALAGAGAADFCDDDGLSGFRRALGGGQKFFDVADALDEQQDHVGGGILHHVVQKLSGAEVAFIAGADAIADRHPERFCAVLDGKADTTGLRDDRDPAFGRDQRHMARLDIDGRAEGRRDLLHLAQKSFGIGPRNPHPRPLRQRHDGVLHGGAVAALLRKPRGNDDGIPDADCGALFERAEHGVSGDDDDGEIDRLSDLGDRFVASEPIDIAVVRIDRIDSSGKFILAQHRQQPPRDLLEIARRPDQRDAVGREERVRAGGTSGPFVNLRADRFHGRHGRAWPGHPRLSTAEVSRPGCPGQARA